MKNAPIQYCGPVRLFDDRHLICKACCLLLLSLLSTLFTFDSYQTYVSNTLAKSVARRFTRTMICLIALPPLPASSCFSVFDLLCQTGKTRAHRTHNQLIKADGHREHFVTFRTNEPPQRAFRRRRRVHLLEALRYLIYERISAASDIRSNGKVVAPLD